MRSHANFAALSLVLPWGLTAELDELQRASLALSPPSMPLSLAMRGEDGMLSVMVPAARRDEARWTASPHFTAIYSAISCRRSDLNPVHAPLFSNSEVQCVLCCDRA